MVSTWVKKIFFSYFSVKDCPVNWIKVPFLPWWYSLVLGFALSLIGSIMLFIGLHTLFAILYSVGIIISLIGTGFLVGFFKQLKMMFQPIRIVATAVLFASLVMVWWVNFSFVFWLFVWKKRNCVWRFLLSSLKDICLCSQYCCPSTHFCHYPLFGLYLGESAEQEESHASQSLPSWSSQTSPALFVSLSRFL